jgi:uncharacterized RDD family membrane protein YckC
MVIDPRRALTTPDHPQPAPPVPLADWATRALGYLIDVAPVAVIGAVFRDNFFLLAPAGLLGVAYTILLGHLDGVTGQTPGKAMMGIRVVGANGELIGSGAGIGRKFSHILDGLVCGLGFLLPLVDVKRQTIADKVMSTFVVADVERKAFSFDLWIPPKT